MKVNIPYTHGETVYLVNDEEQIEYIIISFVVWPSNLLQLRISDGGFHYDVFEFEVSREKNILKKVGRRDEED